jgi:hypothetical protein
VGRPTPAPDAGDDADGVVSDAAASATPPATCDGLPTTDGWTGSAAEDCAARTAATATAESNADATDAVRARAGHESGARRSGVREVFFEKLPTGRPV